VGEGEQLLDLLLIQRIGEEMAYVAAKMDQILEGGDVEGGACQNSIPA
jgi:hypothetical protein